MALYFERRINKQTDCFLAIFPTGKGCFNKEKGKFFPATGKASYTGKNFFRDLIHLELLPLQFCAECTLEI